MKAGYFRGIGGPQGPLSWRQLKDQGVWEVRLLVLKLHTTSHIPTGSTFAKDLFLVHESWRGGIRYDFLSPIFVGESHPNQAEASKGLIFKVW